MCGSPTEGNVITDAVAYSVAPLGNDWLDGHSDSPFDFNRRMIIAGESQREYWIAWREAKLAEGVAEIELNDSLPQFMQDVATIDQLIGWEVTTAPGGLWHNYIDRTEDYGGANEWLAIMPSLGLHELQPQHTRLREGQVIHVPRRREANRGPLTELGRHDPLPAGMDCVAFALRAADWDDFYQWDARRVLPGITEGGTFEPGNIGQTYPRDVATAADAGEAYGVYADLIVDEATARDNLGLVSNVIPGDLMYYGTDAAALEHLAIVQSVTYDENGFASISAIRLIESTQGYEDRVQSIIKRRSIGDDYEGSEWSVVRLRTR